MLPSYPSLTPAQVEPGPHSVSLHGLFPPPSAFIGEAGLTGTWPRAGSACHIMAHSPSTSQATVYDVPRGCPPFVAVHAVEVSPGSLAHGTLLAASNHTILGCRQLGTSPGLEDDIQGRPGLPLVLPASLPATSVPWQPPFLASLHGRPPYLVNRHGTTLATASVGTGAVATAVLAEAGRPVFASRLAVDTPVQAEVAPVAPARLPSPVALVRPRIAALQAPLCCGMVPHEQTEVQVVHR